MIRYQRMQVKNTLVAGRHRPRRSVTQMVVAERKIAAEEGKPVTITAAMRLSTKSGSGKRNWRHHYPSDAVSATPLTGSASASPWTKVFQCRERSLCPPVQRRPDLPWQTPGELGPEAAHRHL